MHTHGPQDEYHITLDYKLSMLFTDLQYPMELTVIIQTAPLFIKYT